MRKDGRLELRLDADLRAKVEALAGLRGGKASSVVRRAIIDAHRLAFPDAPLRPRLQAIVQEKPEIVPSDVAAFHAALWGSAPSEMQQKFYAAYGRGYASVVTDEALDAVVTTALNVAQMREADPVLILAPSEVHPPLFARITASLASAAGKPFESCVKATIERMHAGVPAGWPPKEPRVWVAIGVTIDETTPSWLRRRLVEV